LSNGFGLGADINLKRYERQPITATGRFNNRFALHLRKDRAKPLDQRQLMRMTIRRVHGTLAVAPAFAVL